jgi:hypothetical protein
MTIFSSNPIPSFFYFLNFIIYITCNKKFEFSFFCFSGIVFFLSSCIVPFDAKGVKESVGILVVEGTILNVGTTVTLSRTVSLYNNSLDSVQAVINAHVQIIDDKNNVIAIAEPQINDGMRSSVYKIPDEITFTPGVKYALDILIGDKRYQSAFVSPVMTPEIDEINWKHNIDGSIDIMVSTHDPENKTEYYRWVFEEDWEIRSHQYGAFRYDITNGEVIEQNQFTANNLYYCWASDKSKSMLLSTSERLTESMIKDKVIHNFPPNNSRFSYLYSILVKQYGLNKEAYTYFENLQKNNELSGSLFSPLLYEIKGNIKCLSDIDEPVIGFVTATKVTTSRLFINMQRIEGEDEYDCYSSNLEEHLYSKEQLGQAYGAGLGIWYLSGINNYACRPIRCVDCTKRGGTKTKPDFWPNDHQ